MRDRRILAVLGALGALALTPAQAQQQPPLEVWDRLLEVEVSHGGLRIRVT
jgi:hypothetical protein